MTLGFIGTGEVTSETVDALLADFIGEATAEFLIPVTKDDWNDGLMAVVDFADANSIPFEIVTDGSADTVRSVKKYLTAASKVTKAAKVGPKLVSLLEKAEGKLLVLWSDEDEVASAVVEAAMAAQLVCLDLTTGLEELSFEEGDEEGAEGAEEGDEPYTEEELKALSRDELVAICEANEIEVPNKARASTLIKLILEAPEEEDGAGTPGEEPEEVYDAEDEPEPSKQEAARERVKTKLDEGSVASNGHGVPVGLGGACPHCGARVSLSLTLA